MRHASALQAQIIAPTFAYAAPISPHLAARREGRPIDLHLIAQRANELAQTCDVLVIEAAGGFLTPLGESITNVELIQALGPNRVLLVAPDRLGVLHDVSVCCIAATALRIRIDGVALSSPSSPDHSTGTNAAELERLQRGRIMAVFPRADIKAPESRHAAAAIWNQLGLVTLPHCLTLISTPQPSSHFDKPVFFALGWIKHPWQAEGLIQGFSVE